MLAQRREARYGSVLARKLIVALLLFGSLLTLLLTGGQLVFEYQRDVRMMEDTLAQVQRSHVPSLTEALWTVSDRRLQGVLDRLVEIDGVIAAVVLEQGSVYAQAGAPVDDAVPHTALDLVHGSEKVGEVQLFTDSGTAYERLLERAGVVLSGNALKTALVVLFLSIVLHRLVTRPLSRIATHVADLREDSPYVPLDIRDRVPTTKDEIDLVVDAINDATRRGVEHRDALEQKVAERTQALTTALDLAKQAAEAKSRFLATMSHEIRTPMNGVLGLADLLERTALDADQQQMVTTIRDSGHALLVIINDVLDYSKLEADRIELECIPVDLHATLEGCAATLAPAARDAGVRLVVRIDPALPAAMAGDPTRIRQIALNLLSNAIKFSSSGGVVGAEAKPRPGGGLAISVSDTGIGMTPDAVARLFQPFTQAESSTTRRFGGTGLGLSICKRLVDLMGGEISVTSEPDSGSNFDVSLPLAAIEDVRASMPLLADLRVGFVDSQPLSREAVVGYLGAAGASVQAFASLPSADMLTALDVLVVAEAVVAKTLPTTHCALVLPRDADASPAGSTQATRWLDVDPIRRDALLRAVENAANGEALLEHATVNKRDDRPVEARDDAGMRAVRLHPPPVTSEATSGVHAPVPDGRILVAEDNKVNRLVIGRQLTALGYSFDVAEDGAIAAARFGTQAYALLLTDCDMPNMDGFELTRHVREAQGPDDARVAIVALTANALDGERQRCLDAGMDDYLSKPVDIGELDACLSRWLRA